MRLVVVEFILLLFVVAPRGIVKILNRSRNILEDMNLTILTIQGGPALFLLLSI